MPNDICPCKDCKDRVPEPNCHITCQKYIGWSKRNEERRTKMRNENIASFNLSSKPVITSIKRSKDNGRGKKYG